MWLGKGTLMLDHMAGRSTISPPPSGSLTLYFASRSGSSKRTVPSPTVLISSRLRAGVSIPSLWPEIRWLLSQDSGTSAYSRAGEPHAAHWVGALSHQR